MMQFLRRPATETEQTQIMEILRCHSPIKNDPYRYVYLELRFVTEETVNGFSLGRVFADSEKDVQICEYAVLGSFGVGWSRVKFQSIAIREPDDPDRNRMVTDFEVEKMTETIPSDLMQPIRETIIWREESRLLTDPAYGDGFQMLNAAAVQRQMLKSPDFWREKGVSLAEDFHFTVTTADERIRIRSCAERFVEKYYGDHFKYVVALTDANRSFLVILNLYMADGIKHMGEPDDYGYTILTPETEGAVRVWFTRNVLIQEKRGVIPFSDETICKMVRFYQNYHSFWESALDETAKK
ncbi:MAG: hypothetical protein II916_05490 [Oscillospiraceae bacterium]|nr:hypothetical protein [Oscillospiraceae bacterium]